MNPCSHLRAFALQVSYLNHDFGFSSCSSCFNIARSRNKTMNFCFLTLVHQLSLSYLKAPGARKKYIVSLCFIDYGVLSEDPNKIQLSRKTVWKGVNCIILQKFVFVDMSLMQYWPKMLKKCSCKWKPQWQI